MNEQMKPGATRHLLSWDNGKGEQEPITTGTRADLKVGDRVAQIEFVIGAGTVESIWTVTEIFDREVKRVGGGILRTDTMVRMVDERGRRSTSPTIAPIYGRVL